MWKFIPRLVLLYHFFSLSPLSFSSYLRDNFPLKNEKRRKIRSLYFMLFDKILLDLHNTHTNASNVCSEQHKQLEIYSCNFSVGTGAVPVVERFLKDP